MRISDWSSDVCSSDLGADGVRVAVGHHRPAAGGAAAGMSEAGVGDDRGHGGLGAAVGVAAVAAVAVAVVFAFRSEGRRVGKACVRTFRYGWSPYHSQNKMKCVDMNQVHI